MSKNTVRRAVRPAKNSRGYFLFELIISAMMVAAIVVLAFPTYQDFTPEFDVSGEGPVIEQVEAVQENIITEDPSELTADQDAEQEEASAENNAS